MKHKSEKFDGYSFFSQRLPTTLSSTRGREFNSWKLWMILRSAVLWRHSEKSEKCPLSHRFSSRPELSLSRECERWHDVIKKKKVLYVCKAFIIHMTGWTCRLIVLNFRLWWRHSCRSEPEQDEENFLSSFLLCAPSMTTSLIATETERIFTWTWIRASDDIIHWQHLRQLMRLRRNVKAWKRGEWSVGKTRHGFFYPDDWARRLAHSHQHTIPSSTYAHMTSLSPRNWLNFYFFSLSLSSSHEIFMILNLNGEEEECVAILNMLNSCEGFKIDPLG